MKNWHRVDAVVLGSSDFALINAQFVERLDRHAIVGGPDQLRTIAEADFRTLRPECPELSFCLNY